MNNRSPYFQSMVKTALEPKRAESAVELSG